MNYRLLIVAKLILVVISAISSLSCIHGSRPAAYVNLLEQAAIACPSDLDTNIDDPVACSPQWRPGPARRPGSGELAGINRLPDSLFVDMLENDNYYRVCRDLFESPALLAKLSSLPSSVVASIPAAISPEARGKVLAAVKHVKSWHYCHRVNETADSTIHALYSAQNDSVTLYSTSCEANSVYRQGLRSLDKGHRFFMIAAHELGHGIDAATGQLPVVSDQAAEDRATWYGTFFAQCSSRLWQQILKDNSNVDRTDSQREQRSQFIDQWRAHETRISTLRDELHLDSAAANLTWSSSETAGLFACTTPRKR